MTVQRIKGCGYRVFQPVPGSTWGQREPNWCYYTDPECKKIGYAEWGRGQEKVSSVHMPNPGTGGGYVVADEITSESLAEAISTVCPSRHWQDTPHVRKYPDFKAFCDSEARSKWRYQEV